MEKQGLVPLYRAMKKIKLRLPMIESLASEDVPDLDLNSMVT